MTCWWYTQFWDIRLSVSNSVAYNFNLTQHTQIMWTAVVDNIYNNPSSTTAKDSFHGTSVSLARQLENEGEMRILSESVDMSTRTHGVSPCWLHTRSSSALPATRTVYASVARALQSSYLEKMESYDREKGGLQDYIHSAGNSNHHN